MDKKLYRSRRFRVFGGIAGGLGTYFNIDPIIVRVIFVVVTLLHGLGILAYIILWIVIPEEPFEIAYPQFNGEPTAEANPKPQNMDAPAPKRSSGTVIFGISRTNIT